MNKSFTLIEILTVILIVGILSGIIIVATNNIVDSTQDAKRKKDLDSISKSLMEYGTMTGSYPIEASDCDIGDGTCLNELIDTGYAKNFPLDPSGARYKYTSDGTTYTIKATLSNAQILSYNPNSGYGQYQAYLTGYSKRKSITVSNSGSTLTNYQMKFTVYRSTGTDSGFNVYVGTNCQDDYEDIRFTNSTNTVLDYWIESSDASSAVIWVEADSLNSGNTTLNLYYGNTGATSASSGTNTFIQWHGVASSAFTDSPVISGAFVYEGRGRVNSAGYSVFWGVRYNTDNIAIQVLGASPYRKIQTQNNGTPSALTESGTLTYGTYYSFKIINTGTEVTGYIDENQIDVSSITTNLPDESMGLWLGIYGGGPDQQWSFIRKYTSTEPTIYSWGTEESI